MASVPKLCLPAEKDQRDCTAEDLDYATMSATKRPRPLAPRSRVFAAFMTGTGLVSCLLSKQKVDVQMDAMDASGLTIRQESISMDTAIRCELELLSKIQQ